MTYKLGLFKMDGLELIPSEVFQSRPTNYINSLDKYSFFKIGETAQSSLKFAIQKNLNHYRFFKSDISLPPNTLKTKIQSWSTNLTKKEFLVLKTDVFEDGLNTPLVVSEIFLQGIIEKLIESLSLSKLNKNRKIKIFLTAPPYESTKRKYYVQNLNKVLINLRDYFNNKNIQIDFPEIDSNKYYLFEQFAVYYFYAGITNHIKFKKNGANYLIIDLVAILQYGKHNALTAAQLQTLCNDQTNPSAFRRHIRTLANEARKNGIRVIGDDNGYYKAVNTTEWETYKKRRFSSFADELTAFAKIERITVSDLIKNVYRVNVKDNNYELF